MAGEILTGSGAHPASYPIGTGGGGFPREVKRPWREADNSHATSADVKNTSTNPYVSMT
jgi:hypothetical protein